MAKENKVSLWLGNFKSGKDLEKYIQINYTEDEDSIPSNFNQDFHLGYYDIDFMESNFISTKINDLRSLIGRSSYGGQLIAQFKKLEKEYNSVILIYNYSYRNQNIMVEKVTNMDYELDFIETVTYNYE